MRLGKHKVPASSTTFLAAVLLSVFTYYWLPAPHEVGTSGAGFSDNLEYVMDDEIENYLISEHYSGCVRIKQMPEFPTWVMCVDTPYAELKGWLGSAVFKVSYLADFYIIFMTPFFIIQFILTVGCSLRRRLRK